MEIEATRDEPVTPPLTGVVVTMSAKEARELVNEQASYVTVPNPIGGWGRTRTAAFIQDLNLTLNRG